MQTQILFFQCPNKTTNSIKTIFFFSFSGCHLLFAKLNPLNLGTEKINLVSETARFGIEELGDIFLSIFLPLVNSFLRAVPRSTRGDSGGGGQEGFQRDPKRIFCFHGRCIHFIYS